MSQLAVRDIKNAIAEGLVVMVESHNSVDMLRRYPGRPFAEDLVLNPGSHEFVLVVIQIGTSSPTEWLVLDEPKATGPVYEGASLLYFLGLHNTGKITICLQAPVAEAEAEETTIR